MVIIIEHHDDNFDDNFYEHFDDKFDDNFDDDFDDNFDDNFISSLQCSVFTTLISKPEMGVVIEADEGVRCRLYF